MAKFTEQQLRGFDKALEKEKSLETRTQRNLDEIKERIAGLEAILAEGRKQ